MIAVFALIAWILKIGQCVDTTSFEVNRHDVSPFFDAIIFSDIAEITNDIDNDMNIQSSTKVNDESESESDEDVENLLSEYQHYLEKAQKQRVKYFEKTKGKNKVPLLRHDKFSKVNFPQVHSFDRNRNYHFTYFQPEKVFNNPYDLFVPLHLQREESLPTSNKIIWNENKKMDLPASGHKSGNDAILSSCLCEDNTFPCKCNCKQCFIQIGKKQEPYFEPTKTYNNDNPLIASTSFKNIGYRNENTDDISEGNLNIQIKLDIQMPKIDDVLKKLHDNLFITNATMPKDVDLNETVTPINVSFPSLSFPIPLNIFSHGLSKLYQYGYTPIHKISLHKKKKSHSSNQNKKYKSKLLSFHHGKGNSYQNLRTTEKYINDHENFNNTYQDTKVELWSNVTRVLKPNSNVNKSDVLPLHNETNAIIPVLVNISSDDNLIELETTTQEITNTNNTIRELNNITVLPHFIRKKREDGPIYKTETDGNNNMFNKNLPKVASLNISQNNHDSSKKTDNNQQVIMDNDLLYWPKKSGNNINIMTTKAREGQPHQSNLSISEDNININSTSNIEKSLSKVNWNNIDAVTSMFTSVVGKFVNGILTFCSDRICQSINCADKICIHRRCIPEARFNKRGHCSVASNNTDSTISTESSTDVSLDVVSELIDNLQNKLMGQIFGKATICINVKCISFVAFKKHFTKTKCLKKEYKAAGHCENFKNEKMFRDDVTTFI